MRDSWTPPIIPRRLPGWEGRLARTLESHLDRPFAWGVSDCLTIAADVCMAMTGVDPFPVELRAHYDDERSALALLARLGFDDVSGPLERAFKRIPKARARRGDCGVLADPAGRGRATLIVIGSMAIGRSAAGGLAVVPVLSLDATYAIGAR